MSHYWDVPTNTRWLFSNHDPKYKNPWHEEFSITSYITQSTTYGVRVWGGKTLEEGGFCYTLKSFPWPTNLAGWSDLMKPEFLSRFSLPPENTREHISLVQIPPDTRIQVGICSKIPQWGGEGGMPQILILERLGIERFVDIEILRNLMY